MKVADMKKHPTVVRYYESSAQSATLDNETLDYEWIRELCLEAGADDFGVISIERPNWMISVMTFCPHFHMLRR